MSPEDDLSLGFNFNDDDDDRVEAESADEGAQEDDLADAESNADEDEDYDEDAYNPSKGDLERSVSLAASETGTRVRANGQSFALQRPITADLDSTDELIVSLKEKGYSNDAVSAQLVREGRINYDKKTVGSRYLRLKNAILEREEERLDGELTDWHDGEDEALLKADQLALAEIHDTIARTRAKRWHLVARNVQKILKKEAKYSPSACQKRFVALQHGSASIPPELDDDPTRRFEEKASRVLAALHDQKLKDASERQAKEAKRLASDNLKLQKALEKKERADKRAKDAEEKARIAIEQAAKRAQSAKELEDARKSQADQIQALRSGKPKPAPITRPAVVVTIPSSEKSSSALSKGKSKANEGPRAHLQLKELRELCSQRGLTQSGTKTSLLERLRSDDSTIPVTQLRELLQNRGVSTEGTHNELQERLAQADANNSAWGQRFAGKSGKSGAGGTSSSKRDASAEGDTRLPKRSRPSASEALTDLAGTALGTFSEEDLFDFSGGNDGI
ncbi:hypothetical protein FKW77_002502 [Venturia effusa]|uniref:SAP domain-containing protein n=1 Tax=Venturia effusa TaxID=50376 RepID=A0A517LIA7_9PEZI|nr:hypothetical protein FKW77_002502 [Venturia effusa]